MVPRGYKCHATSPLYQNWSFIKITTTLHYGRLFSMINFFSVIDLTDSNFFWEKNLAVFCNKSRTWTRRETYSSRMFHFYQSFDESQSVLLVKVISLNSMKKNFVGNTFHPESTETATEKLWHLSPPSPQPSQDQIKRGDKARWQRSCIYAVFHTFLGWRTNQNNTQIYTSQDFHCYAVLYQF